MIQPNKQTDKQTNGWIHSITKSKPKSDTFWISLMITTSFLKAIMTQYYKRTQPFQSMTEQKTNVTW